MHTAPSEADLHSKISECWKKLWGVGRESSSQVAKAAEVISMTTEMNELNLGTQEVKVRDWLTALMKKADRTEAELYVLQGLVDDNLFYLSSAMTNLPAEEKSRLNATPRTALSLARMLMKYYKKDQESVVPPAQNFDEAFELLENFKTSDAFRDNNNLGYLGSNVGDQWFLCPDKPPSFRHQGTRPLTRAFLHPRNDTGFQDLNKVLSYPSSSGSGKTVDLASSAHHHYAHLTIYVIEENDVNPDREKRKSESVSKVQGWISKTISIFKSALTPFVYAAINSDLPLKLAVAIDEASSCRSLVRAISAEPPVFGEIAANKFVEKFKSVTGEKKLAVQVSFSVGGTGSNTSVIGSYPQNVDPKETSASLNPANVYESLVVAAEKENGYFPTYEQLEKSFPLLFKTTKSNARMMSIALAEMEKSRYDPDNPKEESLLPNVLMRFLKSNGMSVLQTDADKAKTGALILAVHLFQEAVFLPEETTAREALAHSMDYGARLDDRSLVMEKLVSTYGAVTANRFEDHKSLQKPFEVDFTMQFVALYLLHPPEEASLLEPSPFGYEILCTHIVKAVIAATLVIPQDHRPSIQRALVKIGFEFDTPLAGEMFTDKRLWDELANCVAVNSAYSPEYMRTFVTRQPMTNMRFVPTDSACNEGKMQVCTNPSGAATDEVQVDQKGTYLFLCDGPLFDALIGMDVEENGPFLPPLATVSSGNSEYFDGGVTVFCKNIVAQTDAFKLSVVTQQKDYFSSEITFRKLGENVIRCRSPYLESVFGRRLVAVCSRKEKMAWKNVGSGTISGDFVMYCSDNMQLLDSDVMNTLDAMRNGKTIKSYTRVCHVDPYLPTPSR